jgi:hypothetical protein
VNYQILQGKTRLKLKIIFIVTIFVGLKYPIRRYILDRFFKMMNIAISYSASSFAILAISFEQDYLDTLFSVSYTATRKKIYSNIIDEIVNRKRD